MAAGKWHLEQKRDRLKREVNQSLHFLVGSVTSQGPRGGHSLTTKVSGKTRSKYIRKTMLDEVRRMTRNHAKLKLLLKEIADVNWEILKLENQS